MQMELFNIQDSYNLVGLREKCREYIRNKYPTPVDGEDLFEYNQFLDEEADLEFCNRLRNIIKQIEEKIYGEQSKAIREVYGKM